MLCISQVVIGHIEKNKHLQFENKIKDLLKV